MGNMVLGIVIVASGVIGLAIVVVLFIWGAVKDGQDNDAAQARIHKGEPPTPAN
jgi:nitrogen fixation-related uncharacterized protein